MLAVRGLTVRYGTALAVSELSLNVSKHEAVALVGANGAGKTSTLLGIAGAVARDCVGMTFDNQDISRATPHENARRGLIEVPEGRQLFGDLSVSDNLSLGAYSKRARSVEKESREYVLSLMPALGRLLSNRAGDLSGGEQQMVAVGRALMSRPLLLMLDEPSLGLAPSVATRLYDTLETIRSAGVGMLLVEQNVHLAFSICSRGYVLANGKIVAEGTGRELMHSDTLKEAYLGTV